MLCKSSSAPVAVFQNNDDAMDVVCEDLEYECKDITGTSKLADPFLYDVGLVLFRQNRATESYQYLLNAYNILKQTHRQIAFSHASTCQPSQGCFSSQKGQSKRLVHSLAQALQLCSQFRGNDNAMDKDDGLITSILHDVRSLACLPSETSTSPLSCTSTITCLPINVATSLSTLGRVHLMKENYEDAISCFQECLSIRCVVLGKDHLDVAETHFEIGWVRQHMGRLEQAKMSYQEFLRIAEPVLGRSNEHVAYVLKCRAYIHYELGEKDEALALYWDVLVARIECLGVHKEVALILSRIGKIYFELGEYGTACDVYKHGLQIERAVLPYTDPNVLITLSNIGRTSQMTGDLATALRAQQEVLAIQKITLTCPLHRDIASTLTDMGLTCFLMRKYDDAFELYQEALGVHRELSNGNDDPEVAALLYSVGLSLLKSGAYRLALSNFLESFCIRRALLCKGHGVVDLQESLWGLAKVSEELGEHGLALIYYHELVRIDELTPHPRSQDRTFFLESMASVFYSRGDMADALFCYMEALNIVRAASNPFVTAQVLNRIGNVLAQIGRTKEAMDALVDAARMARKSGISEFELVCVCDLQLFAFAKLFPHGAAAA